MQLFFLGANTVGARGKMFQLVIKTAILSDYSDSQNRICMRSK